MKLLNFLLIKLTICLVIGILVGYYFPVRWEMICYIVFATVAALTVIFYKTRNEVRQSFFFGGLCYATVVLLGVLTITFHTQNNQLHHYSKNLQLTNKGCIRVRIYKRLKPNSFYSKFLAEVISINKQEATGVLLVSVDSTQRLSIDDELYINTLVTKINRPLNPHQFNFRKYMSTQQVYHQVFLNKQNTIKLASSQTLFGVSEMFRKRINTTLNKYPFSKENLSIINALLLGQRQDISKETYKSFTGSGAIHILAISGLHIGLLMFLLGTLFKPIQYFKYGKILLPVLIILILWVYAFITGMSASVVRAVTMFSLVTIAMYSNRITNTYNTLVISAFILLLYNPFYLFDIGFQLSYSAVFAIIWVKPLFDKLWIPKYFVVRKLWDVFSVTIAAQFGILPLSLFYFHQFPGLFFISNLIIIPLLGILLGLGVVVLVFAYIGWIPKPLFLVFDTAISQLNSFVNYVSSKGDFVFTHISFNTVNLVATYLCIVGVVLFWEQASYKRFMFLLSSVICIQMAFIYNKQHFNTEEFVIFNQYKTTLITHKNGDVLHYASKNLKYMQSLENYAVNEFTSTLVRDSLQNVYAFKEKNILIVDEKGVYETSFKPDIVLLTNSPKINLIRLIKMLNPKQIVVDNNNYKSYLKRWRKTCLKQKIPFHMVSEKGAVIIR